MNKLINHFSARFGNQPAGFYVLLYTETCELFGQFAITALLALYMTTMLKSSDNDAFIIYGAFTAFIYAIPLVGGYFADRVSGFKNGILCGIALMIVGNILLIFPYSSFLYIGLSIFSVGCGFFTPSITAIVGRLYTNLDKQRDNAFILYYISKNLGALLATVLCSLVAVHYGYNYAYLLSSIVMLSGGIVFLKGKKKLNIDLMGNVQTKIRYKMSMALLVSVAIALIGLTFVIMMFNLSELFIILVSLISLSIIVGLYAKFDNENRRKLNIILFAILMMISFSTFLGQGGTTINLFIERIINRTVGGYTIPPSMFYALDPFFMILFGTLLMAGLDKLKGNDQISIGFTKIAIGLAVLGMGFLILYISAEKIINTGIKPSAAYVVLAYMLFPIAELCIMPIVISIVTRVAPRGYEGFMIGIYMLGNAIASYLTGAFSKLANINVLLSNVNKIIDAAKIYQRVFLFSALALVLSAILSWIVIGFYKKYVVNKVLLLVERASNHELHGSEESMHEFSDSFNSEREVA